MSFVPNRPKDVDFSIGCDGSKLMKFLTLGDWTRMVQAKLFCRNVLELRTGDGVLSG
jgi:hypothetical protein